MRSGYTVTCGRTSAAEGSDKHLRRRGKKRNSLLGQGAYTGQGGHQSSTDVEDKGVSGTGRPIQSSALDIEALLLDLERLVEIVHPGVYGSRGVTEALGAGFFFLPLSLVGEGAQ